MLREAIVAVVVCGGLAGITAIQSWTDAEPGSAVKTEAEPLRGLVHVNFADAERQKAGLKNINNILKGLGSDDQADLLVICHSGGIGLVVQGRPAEAEQVAALVARGVRFFACENTMREKNLSRDDLLPGVGTVPSGALEVLRKQHEGYAYFRP